MQRLSSVSIIVILTLLSCVDNKTSGQSNNTAESPIIKPFEATVLNSDYSMAYSVLTILTNNQLKIVFNSGIVGEKDAVLFSKSLEPSDTLQQISNINLDSLKEYYSNYCISDGSQVTVAFKKNGKEKSIHLSNFYHEDIGKIIRLINSMVVDKYKTWYDKEKLMADYKECNGN